MKQKLNNKLILYILCTFLVGAAFTLLNMKSDVAALVGISILLIILFLTLKQIKIKQ